METPNLLLFSRRLEVEKELKVEAIKGSFLFSSSSRPNAQQPLQTNPSPFLVSCFFFFFFFTYYLTQHSRIWSRGIASLQEFRNHRDEYVFFTVRVHGCICRYPPHSSTARDYGRGSHPVPALFVVFSRTFLPTRLRHSRSGSCKKECCRPCFKSLSGRLLHDQKRTG